MTNHPNVPARALPALELSRVPDAGGHEPQKGHRPVPVVNAPGAGRRWIGDNPAGAIELTDAELRRALKTAPVCTKYASISTTWCDNPNVC